MKYFYDRKVEVYLVVEGRYLVKRWRKEMTSGETCRMENGGRWKRRCMKRFSWEGRSGIGQR